MEDEETRQQLLQQGFLSTAASMEKIGRFKKTCPLRYGGGFRRNDKLHHGVLVNMQKFSQTAFKLQCFIHDITAVHV